MDSFVIWHPNGHKDALSVYLAKARKLSDLRRRWRHQNKQQPETTKNNNERANERNGTSTGIGQSDTFAS